MEFKENLFRIRKEKGLSQEELAVLCNVSRQAISKWENGTANPDLENLKVLSQSLHVSIDDLVNNKDANQQDVVYIKSRMQFGKEYKSKLAIFGIPLLHINVGFGRRDDGKNHYVAKGIIAIGNISIGLLSIGFMSVGLLSIGLLTLGLLCALGVVSISYFAIGTLAIGYISMGALSIGYYSIGAFAVGYHTSLGAVAYGYEAIGVRAFGEHVYLIKNNETCFINPSDYNHIQMLIENGSFPYIFRMIASVITPC